VPKFESCIPTVGRVVPDSADWFHEIKYDGYRLRIERDGDRVRLITRGGYDWTRRFPWIAEAALRIARRQFVIDGEAVVLGVDGVADFNALHSGKQNGEVQFCASTCWRWTARMSGICRYRCARPTWTGYFRGRPDGIFINPFETGAIGPDLFRAACVMGLEASAATGITEEDGRRTG
jgi:bifunctional non-homologous end joining protein LigD